VIQVVRVSIEVRSGAARFRVGVRASSIRRAVGLVEGPYPAGDVGVGFPIDAEGPLVEDALAEEGLLGGGKPHEEQEELLAA
jgi:hypothetical protein